MITIDGLPFPIIDTETKEKKMNLPTRCEIGEKVLLDFGKNGKLENAYIRAIIFTNAKVRYSVFLEDSKTTIHNIDSVFIKSIEPKEITEFDYADNYS